MTDDVRAALVFFSRNILSAAELRLRLPSLRECFAHGLALTAYVRAQERQTCETCRFRGGLWCCIHPDGVTPAEAEDGIVSHYNTTCEMHGGGCRAWKARTT